MDKERLRERAFSLGIETERKPQDNIVITAVALETPFGGTTETKTALFQGNSAVKYFDAGNFRTSIAAPLESDPYPYFGKSDQKRMSPITAMAELKVREAATQAKLLDENGRINKDLVDPKRVGGCISSGIGATHYLVDVNKTIHDPERGSRRINPFEGLRIFPEQINARPAMSLGYSGWGINSSEACATSASCIVEAARLVKEGLADIVFAGGFEDILRDNKELGIGLFAAMRALSARNDEPEKASRPFDKDRDGFVLGSGGGIVVVESEESALKRGVTPLLRVLGFEKSMDGYDPTELNPDRIATTIAQAIYDRKAKEFYDVDAIFAHATSTLKGDVGEVEAFRKIFGDDLREIPITAIKSIFGHLAGGAGVLNVAAGMFSLQENKIPHILNLDNPDETFVDLNFVRDKPLEKKLNTVLTTAYGFGGYNAVLLLGKYKG